MSAHYDGPQRRASISPAEYLTAAPRYLAALAELGRHPNTAIVRVLEAGPRRFYEIAVELPAVREAAVSEALQELGRAGLVARRVDSGPPLRVLYELTAIGSQLAPSLEGIAHWVEREDDPSR